MIVIMPEPIMPSRLTWEPFTLRLRTPFRLSYGVTESRRTFLLRLAGDEGWGEAAMPPYYGVTDDELIGFWQGAAERLGPFPDDPADIAGCVGEQGPSAARCALDLALHDRIGRLSGQPLHTLLGLPAPSPLPTSFTIAIAAPDEMARLALGAARFSVLKIKLGSDDDLARLAAVREARPDAALRVDANAGWSPDQAVKLIHRLEPLNLELVEQPVGHHDIAGMGYVQARVNVPVVADESCQTLADVEALAAVGVRGINLKLMKAGGLAPGVAMLRRARELGMKVMLGCMVESSLTVTAMAHLAGLAHWLDLDGPLLIANDPFAGMQYDELGRVLPPRGPGIGVKWVAAGSAEG
jgi:L-Ala-D/L-Glu epimerase